MLYLKEEILLKLISLKEIVVWTGKDGREVGLE
jgi:hypothetical protein